MKTFKFLTVLTIVFYSINAFSQETEVHDKDLISLKDVTTFVKNVIDEAAANGEGFFIMEDEVGRKELKLKFKKLHKEQLTKINNEMHFMCVDFKDEENVMYDIDFFLSGPTVEEMSVFRIKIHKVNDVPRYVWTEKDGKWKAKYTDEEAKKFERNENEHQMRNTDGTVPEEEK